MDPNGTYGNEFVIRHLGELSFSEANFEMGDDTKREMVQVHRDCKCRNHVCDKTKYYALLVSKDEEN